MLKYSAKCIKIMFKYAPLETIAKIIQVVITACMVPLSLYFTQQLIDNIGPVISGEGTLLPIFLWSGLLVMAMIMSNSTNFIKSLIWISMQRKFATKFARDIVEKYKVVDYPCFEDADILDTLERMGDNPQEKMLSFFLEVLNVIERLISIIGTLIMFTQVAFWIPLVFSAVMFVKLIINYKAEKLLSILWNGQAKDERAMKYYGKLMSEKHSLFELKIFDSIRYISSLWKARGDKVLTEKLRANVKAHGCFAISAIIEIGWMGAVIFILIRGVGLGIVSIGLLTALIGAIASVIDSSDNLSWSVANMTESYMRVSHYEKFMTLPEVYDNDNADKIISPNIVFEDVYFTYPKTEKELLKGISFEIKSGESIALVGENGAGKSTIIKLLCRLYKPSSGRILINGQDIAELSICQLRSVISVVFQDYINYQLTLRENVAFGDIDRMQDDEAIKQVLRGLFKDDMSENIDVNLGKIEEDGIDLSGGQWQRVAVARAYLSKSSFLVLDEPTASIDPVAESDMYNSFAEVLKDKGSILISHRLASAKMADRIIVITDGIVSEQGSHDQLLDNDKLYRKMWDAQSSWYVGGENNGQEV